MVGGQHVYSELAIETGMMLRLAFNLALRQTEGLMISIFGLLDVPLSTPDHSTLSRRARTMESISKGCVLPDGPIHLLIDSTGLKVFGAGERLQEKHGAKARRTWKKLHPATDDDTGMLHWPRGGAFRSVVDLQHGSESFRRRRVASGKAWRQSASPLKKATPGHGCRHRNDHGLDPDRE